MRNKKATATINREADIMVGSDLYLVGFEITANIDTGSKDTRDTPGKPPSVDEWVDLKLEYAQTVGEKGCEPCSRFSFFEQHILELAEEAGMEWVDDYDEVEREYE